MAMDVDALQIAKSVEKRLEYYMNVRRLEDGFDPAGQGVYRTSHRMAPYDLGHLLVSTKKPRRFRGKITQKLNPQETADTISAEDESNPLSTGKVVKETYVPQVARSDSGFESRSETPHIPRLDINGKKTKLTSKAASSDYPSLPLTPRLTSSARRRVPVMEADRLAKHATRLIETLPLDQLTAMHSSRFHPTPKPVQPQRPRQKDVSPRASSLSRNVHGLLHGTATREYISKAETQRVKSARAYRAKSAKLSPQQPTKPAIEKPRSKSALGLHRPKRKPIRTVTLRDEDFENDDDDDSEIWTSQYLKEDDSASEEVVFKEMPRGPGTTVQLTGWLRQVHFVA
ncbi:Hypp5471 [Branchiostoma lanceolatum]|uniref:Hypp5471 protein n=1 Tax=Branchiostoma lanceolatum TaxID=7740 RepID=A0A8J9VDR5_BRALA|nr:Hypp5471 [Branchiostoma lanceolatum]